MQSKPNDFEAINQPDEIRDLSLNLFNMIENQITRADTKAGLIIAADSVFGTAASLFTRNTIVNLLDPRSSLIERFSDILILLAFAAIFISTIYALLVTRPAMPANQNSGTMFFFGRISLMSYEEFIAKFTGQSSEEFRQALLNEVHATARLARKKFVRIRYSLDFLIIAVVLWGMSQILAAFRG